MSCEHALTTLLSCRHIGFEGEMYCLTYSYFTGGRQLTRQDTESTPEPSVSSSDSSESSDSNKGASDAQSSGETASNQGCAETGTDADLESSVISDDEPAQSGAADSSAQSQEVKEKWVAVKAHSPDPGV